MMTWTLAGRDLARSAWIIAAWAWIAAPPIGGSPVPDAGARAAPSAVAQCLPDGSGYLRAYLSDALTANLDWHGAGIECEGGMRPDGRGLRVSFAGPLLAGGTAHRLRFIFGVETTGQGRSGHALPANVTLILEGERQIFSTRGDDKCTVDALRQAPLARTPRRRDYRVEARGFCVAPAASLTSPARVLVSRFDFVGRISLYPEAPAAPPEPGLPGVAPGAAPRPSVRGQERTAEYRIGDPAPSPSRRPLS